MRAEKNKTQSTQSKLTLVAVLSAVLIALVLWGFWTNQRSGAETTISQITNNQSEYIAKQVTVGGEVNSILTPRIFSIGGDGFIGGDELLVLSARPLPAIATRPTDKLLIEDDIVLIRGEVQRFDIKQAEQELQKTLDPDILKEFIGKPVIFANSIAITPRIDADDAALLTQNPLTDVIFVLTTPERGFLINKPISFERIRVQRIVTPTAMWVGPNKLQRLFVVTNEKTVLKEGDIVSLTGVIKQTPTIEAAKKQWNLQSEDVQKLRNKQIFIAAEQLQKVE